LIASMNECPKSGLHNPFRNKERYLLLGEVCRKVVETMQHKDVWEFFIQSIQRSCPKSYAQTHGELKVTIDFFKNFCGDNVRFLAESKRSPGDHQGQFATSYRWPYGPVGVITPFNFPLEIPVLQMMGALFMGNKVLVKPDIRTGMPLEQFVRLLHFCGLPQNDLSLLYCDGSVAEHVFKKTMQ
jgi:1-pyrroline-5-carboxylate dehydrogenase